MGLGLESLYFSSNHSVLLKDNLVHTQQDRSLFAKTAWQNLSPINDMSIQHVLLPNALLCLPIRIEWYYYGQALVLYWQPITSADWAKSYLSLGCKWQRLVPSHPDWSVCRLWGPLPLDSQPALLPLLVRQLTGCHLQVQRHAQCCRSAAWRVSRCSSCVS